jgi:hypothetical protein
MERELPNIEQSTILALPPAIMELLRDRDEPSETIDDTDKPIPILTSLYIEIDDPDRARLRSDNEDPHEAKDRRDIADPNRAVDRSEKLEPNVA